MDSVKELLKSSTGKIQRSKFRYAKGNRKELMMAELSGIFGYLIIIFLLFAVFSSVWALVTLKDMKKKVAKTESHISGLERQEEETSEDLNQRISALKKSADDTTNQLLANFSGILEKVNKALNDTKNSISGEIKEMIKATKASMKASITETHHALSRGMTDNRKELQRLSQKLEDLSKDVQRMKIDIQERTIDLEL
jgi:DNA anti-recombination protein RmuC